MNSTIEKLEEYVLRQLAAEERGDSIDWLASRDEAFRWIEILDDEGIETSEVVFLFLEETLDRRNLDFGKVRRSQLKKAIQAGKAFLK